MPAVFASREGGATSFTAGHLLPTTFFDPDTMRMGSYLKYRGAGGCGASCLWRLEQRNLRLVEARERHCDVDVASKDAIDAFPVIYRLGAAP